VCIEATLLGAPRGLQSDPAFVQEGVRNDQDEVAARRHQLELFLVGRTIIGQILQQTVRDDNVETIAGLLGHRGVRFSAWQNVNLPAVGELLERTARPEMQLIFAP